MPKEKKPRKKVAKKTKQPKLRQKQRQNVNVNVKIDNSKKTNPRQPNQNKANVSRLPIGGSSTPLNTVIMPATPSPMILQKEPHFAEAVRDIFKDAEMKQNKQLSLLTEDLDNKQYQQNKLLNQLLLQNQPYNPSEVYNDMISIHNSRYPTPIKTRNSSNFEDKNQPVQSKLATPTIQEEESKDEGVLQEEKEDEAVVLVKGRRGRPKLTEQEIQAREDEKERQKELTRSAKKAKREIKQQENIERIQALQKQSSIRKRLRDKRKTKLVLENDIE